MAPIVVMKVEMCYRVEQIRITSVASVAKLRCSLSGEV
jgi:hypothetical protein